MKKNDLDRAKWSKIIWTTKKKETTAPTILEFWDPLLDMLHLGWMLAKGGEASLIVIGMLLWSLRVQCKNIVMSTSSGTLILLCQVSSVRCQTNSDIQNSGKVRWLTTCGCDVTMLSLWRKIEVMVFNRMFTFKMLLRQVSEVLYIFAIKGKHAMSLNARIEREHHNSH
jgi:hypothetical protein